MKYPLCMSLNEKLFSVIDILWNKVLIPSCTVVIPTRLKQYTRLYDDGNGYNILTSPC